MTSADEPYGLFDAEFLRKLQLLEILSRRISRGRLRRFALTRGITFLRTSTATAFEDLILRYLREAMVLA